MTIVFKQTQIWELDFFPLNSLPHKFWRGKDQFGWPPRTYWLGIGCIKKSWEFVFHFQNNLILTSKDEETSRTPPSLKVRVPWALSSINKALDVSTYPEWKNDSFCSLNNILGSAKCSRLSRSHGAPLFGLQNLLICSCWRIKNVAKPSFSEQSCREFQLSWMKAQQRTSRLSVRNLVPEKIDWVSCFQGFLVAIWFLEPVVEFF